MTFRVSIIALVITTLVGCTANDSANLAAQATDNRMQTVERLVQQLNQDAGTVDGKANSQSEEATSVLLTDLVCVPALNIYLEAALKNSPSLQQSIIALKIAYAQQGVTSADRLPSVNAGFDAQNTEESEPSYSADVTVSWELDIWQKIADSSAAASKDIEATQASLEAAQNLLAANIMRGWLETSVNQQLLNIEQRRLVILAQNETLVHERYQTGLGSLEELDNAKSNTASTRATVAQYLEVVAQSDRSLMLLTGQWQPEVAMPEVSAEFPHVINPLDAVPVQNMSGRPDLQQAFYNIEAETLRTDAAYKAMLPSFSLSASLTDIAETPSEALLTNPLWSVLGQMSAPLFQGGKLKSQAEIAQLTTEQSFWAYQETLLNAVNEVENAMGQESSLTLQQTHLDDALLSAQRSIVSYEQKYRQGLVDILDLLTVQQQAYDLEAKLTNTTYQRLLNRIELGLALGLGVSA